jgi:thymidine phosphorylase
MHQTHDVPDCRKSRLRGTTWSGDSIRLPRSPLRRRGSSTKEKAMVEIRTLIDNFSRNPAEHVMAMLIDSVERQGLSDEDLAHLALRLAKSGDVIEVSDDWITADIASTGGPSSLSTLLCPLYLRALGFVVPVLAVPGRPAGGIDVLAQIPGYRVHLTSREAQDILHRCGHVHFMASHSFAPLDALLFSYRQKRRKVNIPQLAIASLLAKKLASSVRTVGLDVRVMSPGNFGASFPEATQNAERFCRVASSLGCRAVCFLTDGSRPYQPFIGRGEALFAITAILTDARDSWLCRHDDMCYAMAHRLAARGTPGQTAGRPSTQTLRENLTANIEAQGSTFERVVQYVSGIESQHHLKIVALHDGFLHVDLASLRETIVKFQNLTASSESPFPDPCGIILKSEHGVYIRKGDVLATLRCVESQAEHFQREVSAVILVKPEPVAGIGFVEVGDG